MRRIRIYKKKKRKINIERLHLEELRLTPSYSNNHVNQLYFIQTQIYQNKEDLFFFELIFQDNSGILYGYTAFINSFRE